MPNHIRLIQEYLVVRGVIPILPIVILGEVEQENYVIIVNVQGVERKLIHITGCQINMRDLIQDMSFLDNIHQKL